MVEDEEEDICAWFESGWIGHSCSKICLLSV